MEGYADLGGEGGLCLSGGKGRGGGTVGGNDGRIWGPGGQVATSRTGQLCGGNGVRVAEWRSSRQGQCPALPRLSSSLPPGALSVASPFPLLSENGRGGRVVEDGSPAGAEEANSDPGREGPGARNGRLLRQGMETGALC